MSVEFPRTDRKQVCIIAILGPTRCNRRKWLSARSPYTNDDRSKTMMTINDDRGVVWVSAGDYTAR